MGRKEKPEHAFQREVAARLREEGIDYRVIDSLKAAEERLKR